MLRQFFFGLREKRKKNYAIKRQRRWQPGNRWLFGLGRIEKLIWPSHNVCMLATVVVEEFEEGIGPYILPK